MLIVIVLGLGAYGVIQFLNQSPTTNPGNLAMQPTPTLLQTERDLGFGNPIYTDTPTEFTFEDPLKVPETVPVYKILQGPEELFSRESVAALARDFGFTGNSQVISTANGYTYYEGDKQLTIQPYIGMVTYSRDVTKVDSSDSSVKNVEGAAGEALKFVKAIHFENPIYQFPNNPVEAYDLSSGFAQKTPGAPVNGYFDVTVPLKVNGLSLVFPQKLYVRVHTSGAIIAANLWYPNLDVTNPEERKIVDFIEAANRAGNGQGVYYNGQTAVIPETEDFTFAQSDLAYFVSNKLLNNFKDTYYISPVYEFTNNNVQMYVSALP